MKFLIFAVAVLLLASPADHEATKAKIARALSAGPTEITNNARVVDTDEHGNTIVLREGSGGFTCMPGKRFWPPMSSTLISGKRDAVPVDAFITVDQASALADWVTASGKKLTAIYATHGHGDHFFGAGTVLERFPRARFIATPDVSQDHGPAGVAAVPQVVLEAAFSRSDFRSSCDRRRTDWKRH
jgi:glyoxylase-like metal-dependent hydrolase (beta-lactamase superfamily II)